VKQLIVNGDDFGASDGINRGVIEAHRVGILTSASLMVDAPAATAAAALAHEAPELGLGLHAVVAPAAGPDLLRRELERQLDRFVALADRRPTHVDSHRNVHRRDPARAVFVAFAERHALPLRGFCGVRHIASFYGQWGGETRLEQVAVPGLTRTLVAEVRDGLNELCCHPGYVEPGLQSSYRIERRAELETLCDPAIAWMLGEQGIRLATFVELEAR
jgi:predicted glycoside hydrolase/deacetylase ChbG (UPF0249 family)